MARLHRPVASKELRERGSWNRVIGAYPSVRILRRLGGTVASRVLGTITHVKTDEAVAALTFDDGPHPTHTREVAETLVAHGAHGTFFMLGQAAREYPGVVRSVAQGGHAIGNHSWDHPSFPAIKGHARRQQIRACQDALTPYGERLFRPPHGRQSFSSRLDAFWLGYEVVAWNVNPEDWVGHRSPEEAAAYLRDAIRPGSVVLLHDTLSLTVVTVRLLLEQMRRRYQFITVPQLLQAGRPSRANWYS